MARRLARRAAEERRQPYAMRQIITLSIIASICCARSFAAAPARGQAGQGQFRAGAAQVDITPPNGTPMAGSYFTRVSTGVLDPIFAKAIVVEQGGAKAALVALDLSYTTRPLVVTARKLIADKTGIPGERVMISATHTHSGPVLTRDSWMDDLTGGKAPPVLEYAAKLPALVARAVAEADAKRVPARAFAAVGREEQLSFNRRYVMRDGSIAWMPPKLSPNIVRPAGPIDPDVGVWYLAGLSRSALPLATYVNFAMHPTVIGGVKFSPDYPGYLAERLADYQGTKMITFFANGCCGNVNQRNPNWADPQSGPREAARVGTVLAAAVFRAWPNLQALRTFAPRVRTTMVTLPRPQFSAADKAEARRMGPRLSEARLSTAAKARIVCILDTLAQADKPLEAEVQVIAVSDELAIVALPGEIFVELGLALKKASPFKYTFIAEQANGSIGYIPNRSAYAEGQYEVISARCAEGSGEMLVDAAVKMLEQLKNQGS